jgi:hypothetical protein
VGRQGQAQLPSDLLAGREHLFSRGLPQLCRQLRSSFPGCAGTWEGCRLSLSMSGALCSSTVYPPGHTGVVLGMPEAQGYLH